MIRNGFRAKCQLCDEDRPGCATVGILGTNAFQDQEWNFFTAVCGPCRKLAHRVWYHEKHVTKPAPRRAESPA